MSELTDTAQRQLNKVDTLLDAYSKGPVSRSQYNYLIKQLARAVDTIEPLIARIKELEDNA